MISAVKGMRDLFSLEGKVAVVTGASSGIGRHFVDVYLDAGARVIAISRTVGDLDQHPEFGTRVNHVVADLADSEQVQSAAQSIGQVTDRVDVLVNAAGLNPRLSADAMTEADWRQTLDLNLTAPFLLTRALIGLLKTSGSGRVIHIASLQSLRAFPNGMAYGATKGGIAQLTRAMAVEWSSQGVNVNAIAPGFFRTPLTEAVFNDIETAEKLASQTCLGRNGKLSDLTGPLIFLSTEASCYVTGQLLFVDGGFTAK